MKQHSRTEYSLINISVNLGGYVFNTIIGFICRIIFVRTLSADYLGINGLFSNILSMLSLAELGLSSAIGYALYKPISQNDETHIKNLMSFYKRAYAIIGTLVAVVGIALMPFLKILISNQPKADINIYLIYTLYLFNTVFSYFYSYKSTLLTAAQRNYIVSGYNYIITIAQSLLQIIYLLLTHEYIGYLLIQTLGGIIYCLLISWKADADYPFLRDKGIRQLPKEEKRELFRNTKALTVSKISGVLVNGTDNIAITYFSGLSSVGFASNYTLISSTLDGLITRTFSALTGSVGNFNASKEAGARYRLFKAINLANFWLYGWAAIGIAFVSGDLIKLLFGEEYILPLRIPIIIAINFYTVGMLHAFYTFKSTLGLFRYGQYILFFTGILNLILDVILGRKFGTFGIFLATFLARICTNAWCEPFAVYKYGFQKNPFIYLAKYIKYSAVLVIAAALCWGACDLCKFHIIVNILLKCLICTIIPFAIFWCSFRKTEEFEYLNSTIFRILK